MTDIRSFSATNPATGASVGTYRGLRDEEAHAIVRSVRAAFDGYKRTSFADRSRWLRKAAELLGERVDELASLMTAEMGKPVRDGRDEVKKCALACNWFAEHAEQMLAREDVDMGPGQRAFITFQPIGVILAIMPWNFPLWQVFRCAAPTLMVGNTVVLKHADNVPGCALAIQRIFRDAGFPEDVFRTLLIDVKQVDELIAHPDIAAVSLTGSVQAGKIVGQAAAAVLKKAVLELGGSDAYVVLADADIAKAAQVSATARMVNGGQSCIAGKRFIVNKSVKAAFEKAMVEAMRAWEYDDPTKETTRFGPLVSVKARDALHGQVEASVAKGAKVLLGGAIPKGEGAFYPATVLTDVTAGQPAHDDELFGPVAAIIEAADDDDALRIANDSRFGLGAAVLTRDAKRGELIAEQKLEAGLAFVNGNVRSDPRLPFGGVKESGYGRECSRYGLLEFVNVKTVFVAS